jgi:hypothetical protein
MIVLEVRNNPSLYRGLGCDSRFQLKRSDSDRATRKQVNALGSPQQHGGKRFGLNGAATAAT